jgi:hypothetical protein
MLYLTSTSYLQASSPVLTAPIFYWPGNVPAHLHHQHLGRPGDYLPGQGGDSGVSGSSCNNLDTHAQRSVKDLNKHNIFPNIPDCPCLPKAPPHNNPPALPCPAQQACCTKAKLLGLLLVLPPGPWQHCPANKDDCTVVPLLDCVCKEHQDTPATNLDATVTNPVARDGLLVQQKRGRALRCQGGIGLGYWDAGIRPLGCPLRTVHTIHCSP